MSMDVDEFLQQQYEMAVRDGQLPEGGFTDQAVSEVTPLDLLNSDNYTDKQMRDERLLMCKGCEHLFRPTRTCKQCGCFMGLKTWLSEATCPLGKW